MLTEPIASARSRTAYLTALTSFAHSIECPTADVTAVVSTASGDQFSYIDNLPKSDDWQHLPADLGARCPVMQHLKRSSAPVAWSADTYARHGVSDIHGAISSLGLNAGLSVCLRVGRVSFIVSTHTDRQLSPRHTSYMSSRLVQFAAAAMAGADGLLFNLTDTEKMRPMTALELEALRHASDGLSVEAISSRLNLSMDDTRSVLTAASLTLGCAKFQAATAKAHRLIII